MDMNKDIRIKEEFVMELKNLIQILYRIQVRRSERWAMRQEYRRNVMELNY